MACVKKEDKKMTLREAIDAINCDICKYAEDCDGKCECGCEGCIWYEKEVSAYEDMMDNELDQILGK